jgi:hypothetical protein
VELAGSMALGLEGETDAKKAGASRNAASAGHLLHALAKASFQLVRECPRNAVRSLFCLACAAVALGGGLPPPAFADVDLLHRTRRGDGDAKLVSNGGAAARGAAQAAAAPGARPSVASPRGYA